MLTRLLCAVGWHEWRPIEDFSMMYCSTTGARVQLPQRRCAYCELKQMDMSPCDGWLASIRINRWTGRAWR